MQTLLVNQISSVELSWHGTHCMITVYPRKNPIRLPLTQIQVILLDPVEAEKITETIQSLLDASETEVEDEDAKGEDLVARLSKLSDLHERGALSDQEFQQAKEKLLAPG